MFGESYLPFLFELKSQKICVLIAIFLFFSKKSSKFILVSSLKFERATTVAKAKFSSMYVDLKNKNYVSMGEGEEKRIVNE